MKKKIAFLFALTGAALLFAGCSSLQTAGTSKFNGQKITASRATAWRTSPATAAASTSCGFR